MSLRSNSLVVLLFLFFGSGTSVFSQIQQELDISHELFLPTSDGQLLVTDGKEIRSIDDEGQVIYEFSENMLGSITAIDQTSSIRPMVFYQDIPAFQVLDNTLSPHSEVIRLADKDLWNVSLMCASSNNGYWLYDPVLSELIRTDEQLNPLVKSGNLNAVLGLTMHPTHMIERGDRLFLNDPENGIHMFDFYGTLIRTVEDSKEIEAFDVRKEKMIFMRDSTLHSIEVPSKLRLLAIAEEREGGFAHFPFDVTSIAIFGERLYVGDGTKIVVMALPRKED